MLGLEATEQDECVNVATISTGSWSGKGIILPNGAEARFSYNWTLHEAMIKENQWVTKKGAYKSPSKAASSVAKTKDGNNPSLNGWVLWEVKRPQDNDWKSLQSLRA